MTITDKIDAITAIPQAYLREDPPAPRSVKIEITARCNYRCLAGDTLVNTIYGKIAIKELSEQYTTVPVYTYKDGEIFIADACNIVKTGVGMELVRVMFDDDTHIDCTPDHRFLQFQSCGTNGGTKEWPVEARHLMPGVSVRALRENVTGGGYVAICWGREFRRKRSRLAMDYIMGRKLARSEQVHHKDHNTSNDHPDNLEYAASAKDHSQKHPEISRRMRESNPAKNMTPEWRENLSKALTGLTRSPEQRLHYRESKLGEKNPNYKDGRESGIKSRIAEINHKVVSVTPLQNRADVYCMEVPASGWFFANDVLVKNCSFCALRTRENQPKGDMDIALFRRITVDMRCAGVEEIGLFYLGESFTSPELLVEAIEWCKRELHFPYVFLTTNGSLAEPGLVCRCMSAGLDSLKWSVNAADEAQFEQIMGVKRSLFRKSLENLKSARAVRDAGAFKCGLYASSIQYDGEQGARMQAMLGRDVIPFVDCHYLLPLYGQMTHWNEDRTASLGYAPTAGNQGRIGALRDPLPCWSAFTEGHVTADGILTACCFDSDGRFAMGDLVRQSFMQAWHSEAFRDLRAAHLAKNVENTICMGCLAYK